MVSSDTINGIVVLFSVMGACALFLTVIIFAKGIKDKYLRSN